MKSFQGLERAEVGKKALVCGTGPSMALLEGFVPPQDVVVIGVNRIYEWMDTVDYHFVVDPPSRFAPDTIALMSNVKVRKARLVSTYGVPQWEEHWPHALAFQVWPTKDLSKHDRHIPPIHLFDGCEPGIPCAISSPFAACAFTAFLRCTDCYLIGADYTDHAELTPKLDAIKLSFTKLRPWMQARGTNLWNLNPDSVLDIPHCPVDALAESV